MVKFKVGDVVRIRIYDAGYPSQGFAKKMNGLVGVVMSTKTGVFQVQVEVLFPEEPFPPGDGIYWWWATNLEKVE